MKFSVEVELDWIGDRDMDAAFHAAVTEQVVSAIREDVQKQVIEGISKQVEDKITDWIDETLKGFVNRPISVTDKWGDVLETHENVIELLKQKFDTFLSEPVSQDGRPRKSCSYGKEYTRIEHLIDANIKKMGDKFMEGVLKAAEDQARQVFSDELKKKMSSKLAESMLSGLKSDIVDKEDS